MKNVTEQTPSDNALDQAFTIVAFGRLKHLGESFTENRVIAEAARIERCVEYMYKLDKLMELNYQQFASAFLKDNLTQLISGNKYSGLYLSDVDDDVKEKECYMEDANLIF